ncbi:MerR family transcriptional regulator [bacterium]|nr:MerR family transcriptional regulator [bacterium]
MVIKKTKKRKSYEKLYYSITEVGELTALKSHILRYWETEFPFLRPKRNRAGNRAYRRKDIDMIILIKKLLYDEGYTIEGAKHRIRQIRKSARVAKQKESRQNIPEECRKLMEDILNDLTEISELLG